MLATEQSHSTWILAVLPCLGALLSVTASVIRILSERRRKALTCDIVSTPVFSFHQEMPGRIRVLFDDRPVNDVGLVIVKFTNSGSQTISTEDFQGCLSCCFTGSSEIISAEVQETLPPNLPVALEVDNGTTGANAPPSVKIPPLLLNSGDFVALKILVTDFANVAFDLHYHIRDIPHIAKRFRRPFKRQWTYLVAVPVNLIGVSALVIVGRPVHSWFTTALIILSVAPVFMLPYLVEIIDAHIIRRRSRGMEEHTRARATALANLNQESYR